MNPEDMPKNVWRWLDRQSPPFLFIRTSGYVATLMYFDDDPEAVEVVVKAYQEFMSKRHEEKKKK
jgi:hypothetical protein